MDKEPDIAKVQVKPLEQEQEKQEQEQRVDPAAAQRPERGRSQITVRRHRANVRQMWDSKFPWIQNLRKRGWSKNHRKTNKTKKKIKGVWQRLNTALTMQRGKEHDNEAGQNKEWCGAHFVEKTIKLPQAFPTGEEIR